MQSKLTCGLLVALLASGALAAKDDEQLQAATQNPVLRQHFRLEARETRAFYDRLGRKKHREDPFLEERVDALVLHFLRRLKRRNEELRQQMALVSGAVHRLSQAAGENQRQSVKERLLHPLLVTLGEKAGTLRRTLSRVMAGFEETAATRPQGVPSAADPEGDLKLLAKQVEAATGRIQAYFFDNQPTISVWDLQGQNILLLLQSVSRTSRRLSQD